MVMFSENTLFFGSDNTGKSIQPFFSILMIQGTKKPLVLVKI